MGKYRKMTYDVIIPGHLHMPLYFIGTFTEYPCIIIELITKNHPQIVGGFVTSEGLEPSAH